MATVAETLRLDGELGGQLLARLPAIVAVVLVVLIGFRLAVLVADLSGAPVIDSVAPVGAAPVVRNVVDVPTILRANLFGQSAPAGGSGAPVSSMPLTLTGVIAARDEKQGIALIGTAPNIVEMKRVGDPLPGGATLHAVHVDRVLINRGGSIEALVLPELLGAGFAPPPQAATVINPTAMSMQRVEQAIRGNPALIGQVMHRTPVFADGRLRGIRVSPGPNAVAFTRLGLRNNDLVTAINGVQMNDEARSRDVFDSLSGAAEARVTVDRGGSIQELVLNLSDIASEAEQIATAPPPPPMVEPATVEAPPLEPPPGVPPGPDPGSAR